MTEKKQEIHSETPSTAEALAEADYNDDRQWHFVPIPSFLFRRKSKDGDYYEIVDTWGVR